MKEIALQNNKRRIVTMVLFIIHCSLFICPVGAQTTFTQRIQQSAQGEGQVTIHQDAAIDQVVNGVSTVPQKQQTTPQKQTPQKDDDKPSETIHHNDTTHQQAQNTTEQSDSLTTGPKRYFKTTGFRIQVFAGGNKRVDQQKATRMRRSLEQLFPNDPVYVHFFSPRWTCRMGNYRTYEEAYQKMMELRQLGYESATIVKGKIIVTQ